MNSCDRRMLRYMAGVIGKNTALEVDKDVLIKGVA